MQAARQLVYIVTYVLAHLVVMGQLSILKLPCLPSDLLYILDSLCVFTSVMKDTYTTQQDIYTTKVKGNKEYTRVLDHPHGLQLMGSFLS